MEHIKLFAQKMDDHNEIIRNELDDMRREINVLKRKYEFISTMKKSININVRSINLNEIMNMSKKLVYYPYKYPDVLYEEAVLFERKSIIKDYLDLVETDELEFINDFIIYRSSYLTLENFPIEITDSYRLEFKNQKRGDFKYMNAIENFFRKNNELNKDFFRYFLEGCLNNMQDLLEFFVQIEYPLKEFDNCKDLVINIIKGNEFAKTLISPIKIDFIYASQNKNYKISSNTNFVFPACYLYVLIKVFSNIISKYEYEDYVFEYFFNVKKEYNDFYSDFYFYIIKHFLSLIKRYGMITKNIFYTSSFTGTQDKFAYEKFLFAESKNL